MDDGYITITRAGMLAVGCFVGSLAVALVLVAAAFLAVWL